MRLAIVSSAQAGHGTFDGLLDFGRCLGERGHDLTLFFRSPDRWLASRVSDKDNAKVIETVRGVSLRGGKLSTLGIAQRVYYLSRNRWDALLLMSALPDSSIPAYFARSRGWAKRVVAFWSSPHGTGSSWPRRGILSDWSIPLLDRMEEKSLRKADGVVAWSSILYDLLRSWQIPEQTTLLLRSGANLEVVAPLDKTICRQSIGIPADAHVLAYMSTEPSSGNVKYLVGVLEHILKFMPTAHLIVISDPGTWQRDVERFGSHLIQVANLPYEKISSVLCAADVLLLPFKSDVPGSHARWVGRIAEYLACGRPIVTCDVGEIGTYIRESGVGVLSHPEEIDFAKTTMALLKDPDQLSKLGRKARQVAEAKHDWSSISEAVEAFVLRLARSTEVETR